MEDSKMYCPTNIHSHINLYDFKNVSVPLHEGTFKQEIHTDLISIQLVGELFPF